MFTIVVVGLFVLAFAKERSSHHDHNDDDDDDGHRTIVLIHGAFQDASGFQALANELHTRYGYRVFAPNLPGRPANPTPALPTLQDYINEVQSLIESIDGRVVLVGHSFGGITISAVANNIPNKIRALVYLSAYLPLNGESGFGISETYDANSHLGTSCALVPAFTPASATTPSTVEPCPGAQFGQVFCPDCNAAQLAQVIASEVPEPFAPATTNVVLGDNYNNARKYYIVTLQDEAISAQLQGFMLTRQHVEDVFVVNAGHLSFITQPEVDAKFINDAAEDAHRDHK